MAYEVREELEPRSIGAISSELLDDHFRIYKSFVQHTNSLQAELQAMRSNDQGGSLLYLERAKRISFEANGLILHELFFENLSPQKTEIQGELAELLEKSFGSLDAWRGDFNHISKCRGNGWAILFYDPQMEQVLQTFVDSNHLGVPLGWVPLLVLDLWEHAYIRDFGAHGRDSYVMKIFEYLDFNRASERLLAGRSKLNS